MDFTSEAEKFYVEVQDELLKWEVPELTMERIHFRDGGLLSQRREYLRIQRETLVFDIVSAKFGKCWWFSSRSAVLPRSLKWWEVIVFLGLMAGLFAAYVYAFGQFVGSIALGSTLAMLLVMMVAGRSWNGLDDLLLKLPVIGAFYEALFRAESYYRDDARRMYVSIVDRLVRDKVKEFAAGGGVKEVVFNEISDVHQLTSALDRVREFVAQATSQVVVSRK